jgi:hypothetical protein
MIILQPNESPHREGLIIMTTYTTRTLAEEILPDAAEANIKNATRTLRKFLRDELGEGKAVVGKGGRYALDYNKRELTSLKKKFAAWEIAQEEAKAARREALEAAKATTAPIEAETDNTDDEVDADFEPEDDNEVEGTEGPTDEEIAAMLSDDDIED